MKRTDVFLAMGSPALLRSAEEALLREGLSVETCGNGIDAVISVIELKPRCVLCSQVLSGMDGFKTARLINSVFSRGEIPVIISIPDSTRKGRGRAISSGAIAVIDYSIPMAELVSLVKLHQSSARNPAGRGEIVLSRDRVFPMAAECLEDALETAETVVEFSRELRATASVAEACRKLVSAVLTGLGFQRAWVGLLNGSGTALEAVAYKGRGITGDPVILSGGGVAHSADVAISSGIQVLSWELDLTGRAGKWEGSSLYADTPIRSGNNIRGILRCDNGLSKRRPSAESLRSLRKLSDLLSGFLRYLDSQNSLDHFRGIMGLSLTQINSVLLIADENGTVKQILGDASVLGTVAPQRGDQIEKALEGLSGSIPGRISGSIASRKPLSIRTALLENGGYADITLAFADQGEAVVGISSASETGKLRERVRLLEHETDAIASLAADLSSQDDIQEICRTILRTLEQFYPTESMAVMAARESSSSLVPASLVVHAVSGSSYRHGALLPGATIPIQESAPGVVVEAVRSGKMQNISDVLECSIYLEGLSNTRSEIAVPMLSRGRVVGVVDIQSPNLNRFRADDIRLLNNVIGFSAGIMENALQQTELIRMARRDRLTGLHNMTYFEERYPEEFDRAQRYQYPFSVIMMDIDDFKIYNDTHGHPTGNVLLQRITTAIRAALRDVDILVRFGGEEFLCILPLTDRQVAAEVAERIRNYVLDANDSIPHAGQQPRGCVSLSLGVASFPVDSRDKDELVEIADQRMYRAKRSGKNSVCHS